ncbi:hypothetical protein ABIB40_000149 [Pedobacter sp. UYP30]|uniref:hypothetical protein n=1 Tax=Pedobacter sp. UYP30 TaxID=1756400 RepID=UPI00339AA172
MSGRRNSITLISRVFVWFLALVFSAIPFIEAFHYHEEQPQTEKLTKHYNSGLNFKINSKQCAICQYMLTKEARLFYNTPSVISSPHRVEYIVKYVNTVQLYLSKKRLLFYGKSPPLI